jgi:flagellar protein FliT
MNQNADYFARYEAIAAVSRKMLVAARRSRWSELVGLQDEYLTLVDGLKDAEAKVLLDDTERARKFDLIRQILADDAAIRDLASPSVARLSALLATERPARVLKELYGAR